MHCANRTRETNQLTSLAILPQANGTSLRDIKQKKASSFCPKVTLKCHGILAVISWKLQFPFIFPRALFSAWNYLHDHIELQTKFDGFLLNHQICLKPVQTLHIEVFKNSLQR